MNRQLPPDLTSILSTLVQWSLGPHHFGRSLGSFIALNTSSRGASKTRVIVISFLPGSEMHSGFAIVAAPLPFFLSPIVFLLLLDGLQVVVHPIETFVPEAAVSLHPLRDVSQR